MQQRDALALQINHRFFYGWAMVAVAALGMFASGPAQSHLFSVFIRPISEDLGISRTAVSSAYAGATLVAAFGLPYVGRLVDRYGVRRVVLLVALLFGAACIAFGTRRSRAAAGARLRRAALPRPGLADAVQRQPGGAVVQQAARLRAQPDGARLLAPASRVTRRSRSG